MTVWFSIVASIAFMYMTAPEYEFGTAIRIILAVVYASAFIGGMAYDLNKKDKIEKLEKEVAKLKKNNKEI